MRQGLLSPFSRKFSLLLTTLFLISTFITPPASAAQITPRYVTIGSSAPSAVTNYTFVFTVPTTTAIKSADFLACTTPTGTCTPAGITNSAATVTTQPVNLGAASGWTVNDATAGDLRIVDSVNATAPTGTQTVYFSTVTNPNTTNSTFFFRMTTYSDAAWTTPIDTGTVATSTAAQIQTNLTVSEALTFCTGTTITGTNCGTAAGSTVNLGYASTSTTATGTSILSAATNASSGYSITYSAPNTLMSGSNPITAISDAASTVGTKQFGLNLVANTTPAVGTAVSGTGTATATNTAGFYNSANNFTFHTSGDTVASVSAPTNGNTFTVSYIANIDSLTPPGAYTTTLTYTATANF
jgi:hypothetical protein